MSKKTILIFGAGENQLTLINAATELSVRSVVIDPNPDALGKRIADVFEIITPNDYERTKKVAIHYGVDGIVTSQMENPLRLMARLAEDLDFVFLSQDVTENCRNKFKMKQVFLANEIPCAKGILLKSNNEIYKYNWNEQSFPMVMKPIDSYSSRGVVIVNNIKEIRNNFDIVKSFSSDKSVIVEEYLQGQEYSVEAITFKGKTSIIQYTEKIITPPPYSVEIGHLQPADITPDQRAEIDRLVMNSITALGIESSATHTEVILTEEGFKLIEIGARLGGDYISSYLTLASTGINMDKAAIQIALNNHPEYYGCVESCSLIKYLDLPQGKTVTTIGPWKEILESEDVIHAQIFINKGDTISKLTDSSKRTGFLIIKAKNRADVMLKMNRLFEKFSSYIILN